MSLCMVWFGSFLKGVLLEGNDHLQTSRGLLHKKTGLQVKGNLCLLCRFNTTPRTEVWNGES